MNNGARNDMTIPKRNRRDHYLPQGYLKGFIDPVRLNYARPLWQFDIASQTWSERSPREVGFHYGFYDYSDGEIVSESADSAFAELERNFPKIRHDLISKTFRNFKDHLEFLLRFVQMMRARSPLFFEHVIEEGKSLRAFVVEDVSHDRKSLTVRSMTPEPLPYSFVRNRTITRMRSEIQQGPAWLRDFNWAVRYSETAAMPFITSEVPLRAEGKLTELSDAIRDQETLLFFPLCWQACLIGSRQFFEKEVDRFQAEDIRRFQRMYRKTAKLFLLSPGKLEFSETTN